MSMKLYPSIHLKSSNSATAFFQTQNSRTMLFPKVLNWRLPDQTSPPAEELLNTDGSTLLNTDGESLFNTGA